MLQTLSTAHSSQYQLDLHQRFIYYLDKGQGPTVVLLHGNGAQAALYGSIIDRLVDTGAFRVLAPDLPGYGRSLTHTESDIFDYIAQIERFIQNHVKGPFYLIGHSLGGLLAYLLMQRKRTPQILAAVWIEASIFDIGWKASAVLPAYAWLYARRGHSRDRLQRQIASLSLHLAQRDPLFYELFIQSFMQSNLRVQSMFYAEYPRLLPLQLSQIKTPVLCIRGEEDSIVSRSTPFLVQHLAQAQSLTIPDAGHFILGENDQALEHAILNFLGQQAALH